MGVVGPGECGGVVRVVMVMEGEVLSDADGLKVKAGKALMEGRWRRATCGGKVAEVGLFCDRGLWFNAYQF